MNVRSEQSWCRVDRDHARTATFFLAGDVMTGRGVDQILESPGDPRLGEAWVRDARDYVRLAERASGAIPRRVGPEYVLGELLAELARIGPAARIVNLETSITQRGAEWPGKAVHYRMTPQNVGCLAAARLDVCALANNHVLDYGAQGLEDTLATLAGAGIAVAGAGRDLASAQRPAVVPLAGGERVAVVAVATEDSGVPWAWAARDDRAGVDLLADFSGASSEALCARIAALDREGHLVIASLHWGSNWGDEIPERHVALAHRLIDAGADIVHGHSSHHPRAIEIHRDRLILYGCGDLVTDYEGIENPELARHRGELGLAYFPELDLATGALIGLAMMPTRMRRLRVERAGPEEREWLRARLERVSARFGTAVSLRADGCLALGGTR